MSRARKPESAESESAEAGESTTEANLTSSVSTPRKKRARKVRPVNNRKRCTVELTYKLDWILSQIAVRRNVDKYDLIYNLVLDGIKVYGEYGSCEAFYDATLCQALQVA